MGKYSTKVRKIAINSYLGCPHHDTKAGGCSYCFSGGGGFSQGSASPAEQLDRGVKSLVRKGSGKFIAYFQSYTNTNAEPEVLKNLYDIILPYSEVVGLAIGTRPDAVTPEILKLISRYTERREVWVEYGLQSASDETLRKINRGHTVEDFINAVSITRKHPGINICVHLIVGLPGESMDDYIRTVKLIAELKVEGVKFHPLHIIKGTPMENDYEKGALNLMDMATYAETVAHLIEYLHPDTIIQRLTADAPRSILVAPEWINEKGRVIHSIEKHLSGSGGFQGRKHKYD